MSIAAIRMYYMHVENCQNKIEKIKKSSHWIVEKFNKAFLCLNEN